MDASELIDNRFQAESTEFNTEELFRVQDKTYFSASAALEDYIYFQEGRLPNPFTEKYQQDLLKLFDIPINPNNFNKSFDESKIYKSQENFNYESPYHDMSLQITSTPVVTRNNRLSDYVDGLSPIINKKNETLRNFSEEIQTSSSVDTQTALEKQFDKENERRRQFVHNLMKEIEDDVESVVSSIGDLNRGFSEDENTERLLKRTEELCEKADRCFNYGNGLNFYSRNQMENDVTIDDNKSQSSCEKTSLDVSLIINEINANLSENSEENNIANEQPCGNDMTDKLKNSICRGERITEQLSNSIQHLINCKDEKISKSDSLEKAVFHLEKLKSLLKNN